ncbi:phage holin family protein [Ferrovum sp.]|uniref:phage holin family protein n=1 Tax=Ferrovum sp. TaxID=2609467 RepID=UPI002622BC13|nr:phage holin family protein [Ferrovum sp.]
MSEKISGARAGLFSSLRVLATTLVAVAHTRLDLLSTELEEEREYFLAQLVLILMALFLLGIGVVLATILLVMAFWDTHRLLVLGLFSGFFLGAGMMAWGVAWRKARVKPKPFSASLSELFKDRQQIETR